MKLKTNKHVSKSPSLLKIKAGFTLIELLVVITIIAVLASIAMPVYNNIFRKGDMAKANQHARQVVLACINFASDNDSKLPSATLADKRNGRKGGTSNDVLSLLVPRYTAGSEDIFSIPACDVAEKVGSEGPDGTFKDDGSDSLQAGENHWAYTDGRKLGDSRIYPLIMDAFANTNTPAYSDVEGSVGGRWGGENAIVAFTDSSSKIMDLDPDNFTVKKNEDIPNGFSVKPWSRIKSKILNPDGS